MSSLPRATSVALAATTGVPTGRQHPRTVARQRNSRLLSLGRFAPSSQTLRPSRRADNPRTTRKAIHRSGRAKRNACLERWQHDHLHQGRETRRDVAVARRQDRRRSHPPARRSTAPTARLRDGLARIARGPRTFTPSRCRKFFSRVPVIAVRASVTSARPRADPRPSTSAGTPEVTAPTSAVIGEARQATPPDRRTPRGTARRVSWRTVRTTGRSAHTTDCPRRITSMGTTDETAPTSEATIGVGEPICPTRRPVPPGGR